MRPIEEALRKDGYRVVNFGYRSRSETIGDIADSLAGRIQGLMEEEPVAGISFVTHSMGSIVVRYCLAHYREIPVKRFIMIAPPNRGSVMASYLKRWLPYRLIFGRAVEELARTSDSLVSRLPEPRGQFGVIAGGTGASTGINPFIPGDDDGTVSVEETRLSGMSDFIQVRGQHSTLLFQRRVMANVLSFLQDGRFLHDN
jgi:pimeloyl-ACP methyl ester carboxylesterase